ncbi:MAG: hypothetical protein ACXWLQ_06520, partial [Rhizomicrobium sp.]
MGYEGPNIIKLLDADALRRALTALAHEAGDKAKLRKDALALIKGAFLDARALVKTDVESGALT